MNPASAFENSESGQRARARNVAIGFGIAALGTGAAWALHQFPPGQAAFYPRCVFNQVTGWECAGCGGLRAVHHLLHGRLAQAFACNGLVVAALPIALVVGTAWLRNRRRHRLGVGGGIMSGAAGWALVLAALLLFTIGRNVF